VCLCCVCVILLLVCVHVLCADTPVTFVLVLLVSDCKPGSEAFAPLGCCNCKPLSRTQNMPVPSAFVGGGSRYLPDFLGHAFSKATTRIGDCKTRCLWLRYSKGRGVPPPDHSKTNRGCEKRRVTTWREPWLFMAATTPQVVVMRRWQLVGGGPGACVRIVIAQGQWGRTACVPQLTAPALDASCRPSKVAST
jgi:hypothetical protein